MQITYLNAIVNYLQLGFLLCFLMLFLHDYHQFVSLFPCYAF